MWIRLVMFISQIKTLIYFIINILHTIKIWWTDPKVTTTDLCLLLLMLSYPLLEYGQNLWLASKTENWQRWWNSKSMVMLPYMIKVIVCHFHEYTLSLCLAKETYSKNSPFSVLKKWSLRHPPANNKKQRLSVL